MPEDTPERRIAVIGAGTMGSGIIETAAVSGLAVSVFEPSAAQAKKSLNNIESSIVKGIRRGKVSLAAPDEALRNVTWHDNLQACVADVSFVIEAVIEQEDAKLDVFRALDAASPADAILASNTSSISLTRLAAATSRPAQVVGMHFFNPVPIMQSVEIVRALQTSDETVERTSRLATRMGKQPLIVKDSPGFVVNRLLGPLLNEAIFALEEQVAEPATIDSLMKLGLNHPMGPLELADLIGLDVCLSILQVLHREFGDPKFRPAPLLVRMVAAGRLGRKSGQGFYVYQ